MRRFVTWLQNTAVVWIKAINILHLLALLYCRPSSYKIVCPQHAQIKWTHLIKNGQKSNAHVSCWDNVVSCYLVK
uniref:Uncharacterized protein n=1 Tax=Populus trichocarpa TaxID=3694 RepID=A0A2K2APH0_POPTR